jgi:hypothetical protein
MDATTWSLCVALLLCLVAAGLAVCYRRTEGFTGTRSAFSADGDARILPSLEDNLPRPKARVAVATVLRRPVDFPLWLRYHRRLGVVRFYVRLEDSPGWEDLLNAQADVVLELGRSDPGGDNYHTLQDRQVDHGNRVLGQALASGDVDWLAQLDGDELLHGGAGEGLSFLDAMPPETTVLKLSNVEAVYSKKGAAAGDSCFSAREFLRCDLGAPCTSYVNGKGMGRVVRGVSVLGPHDFSPPEGAAPAVSVPFESLHVLHFEGCSFSAWLEKFRHLGDRPKTTDSTPFPAYEEAIDVARKAHDAYLRIKGRDFVESEAAVLRIS